MEMFHYHYLLKSNLERIEFLEHFANDYLNHLDAYIRMGNDVKEVKDAVIVIMDIFSEKLNDLMNEEGNFSTNELFSIYKLLNQTYDSLFSLSLKVKFQYLDDEDEIPFAVQRAMRILENSGIRFDLFAQNSVDDEPELISSNKKDLPDNVVKIDGKIS